MSSASTTTTGLELVGTAKTFHRKGSSVEALAPIDLSIDAGEFVAVVGPSGCGKSTLMRLVAGLEEPSAGSVTVRVSSSHALAMVFQDYGVYPWKTVAANVRFGLECAGRPRAEIGQRVDKWLRITQIEDFADAWPHQLSGGMRQRVALARALATEPQVLLLDEPFAALDPQLRALMQDELLRLTQGDALDPRPAVMMVTHSLEEAVYLADRVVVLSARPGRVLLDRQVPFERPRSSALRSDARFAALQQELWDVLRDEVVEGMDRRED